MTALGMTERNIEAVAFPTTYTALGAISEITRNRAAYSTGAKLLMIRCEDHGAAFTISDPISFKRREKMGLPWIR